MGKGSQVVGFRYYLGVEAACSIGPVDEMSQLLIGDRIAWRGSVTASGSIDLDQPNLFGGDLREGGVSGIIEVRMGEPTQVADPYMTAIIGNRIPANRGIFSLIFRGRSYAEYHAQGYTISNNTSMLAAVGAPVGLKLIYKAYMGPSSFYWASGNPYIKTITPTLTRILAGWNTAVWYPEKAKIVQTQDYSSPPNQSDTGQTFLRVATGASDTTLYYPSGYTDLTADFVGYAQIEAEWVRVTAVNDGNEGGSGTFFQSMTVQRGWFGTDRATHAGNTIIYLYQVDFVPLKAMNPAHILYQCLTDTVWGAGKPTALINDTRWRAAADTLYAEGFGLCLMWFEQSSLEDFINEVLQHIDGILDVNLRTGLYELRLIRNDYDASTLPVFDQSSILSFESFERPGWGETTNELVVKFTNQATGGASSGVVQDLANIYIQGQVVSQTHQYLGVQYPPLAYRLADRDLRVLSTPLAHGSFKANRSAWPLQKGDPIKITWAPWQLNQLVCRVIDIDYGALEAGEIAITWLEDIFALPTYTYLTPQQPLWQNPAAAPRTITTVKVTEVPYYLLAAVRNPALLTGTESFPLILGQRPAIQNQQMLPYQSDTAGFTDFVKLTPARYTVSAILSAPVEWDDTVLPFGAFFGGTPEPYSGGGLALVDDEWVGIVLVDMTAETMTVVRGVLDSIPVPHGIGATMWCVAQGTNVQGFVGVTGAAVSTKGHTEYYRETGKSPSGETALSSAPQQTHTHLASWFSPYPPARVRLDAADYPARIRGDFTITWAGRNRLQQTVGLIGWSDASILPESGVTYTLEVYNSTTLALIGRFAGLAVTGSAGGSFQFHADAGTATGYVVKFYAVRGSASSQVYSNTATIYGYGLDYGNSWGGAELGVVLPRGVVTIYASNLTVVPTPVWLNDVWYSTSDSGGTVKSLDGLSWFGEAPPSPSSVGENQAYGNGLFAAWGRSGNAAVYQRRRSGGAWQPGTAFTGGSFFAQTISTLLYDGTQFVAMMGSGSDFFTSPDLEVWTHVGPPTVNTVTVNLSAYWLTRVGSTYVAIGLATAGGLRIATSADLLTWTVNPVTFDYRGEVAFWNGYYYLVSGGTLQRSADCVTWTALSVPVSLAAFDSGWWSITAGSLCLQGLVSIPPIGFATASFAACNLRTTNGTTWSEFTPSFGSTRLVGEKPFALNSGSAPPHLFIQVAQPVEFGGKLLSVQDYGNMTPTVAWPAAAPNGKYFGVPGPSGELQTPDGQPIYADSGLTNRFTQAGDIASPKINTAGKHYLEVTLVSFAPGYPRPNQSVFFLGTQIGGVYGRGDVDFLPQLGDVIGLALDFTTQTQKIYHNNVLVKTTAVPPGIGVYFFCEADGQRQNQYTYPKLAGIHVNVGQEPFTYPQSGFTAWQD